MPALAHLRTREPLTPEPRTRERRGASPHLRQPRGERNPCVLPGEGSTATQINLSRSPPGDGFICSCSGRGGYHPRSPPRTPRGAPSSWLSPYITSTLFVPFFNSVFQGSVCLREDHLLFSLAPPGEERATHNLLLKAPRKSC